MLTVLISDFCATTWPRQPASYSVLRPKGSFSATPNRRLGLISMVKNPLGISAQLPTSPPSPVPGNANAPVELPFEYLKEGFRKFPAMANCLPEGSNVIAAGFDQATLASSATAAPPAKAFPVPLPLCVAIPKPPAIALDVIPVSAEKTDTVIILLSFFMTSLL